MTKYDFEELSHTAEVGLRVRASGQAALFSCAAIGMFAIIGVQPSDHSAQRRITIESFDTESLLVDWLNELIYLYETTGEIYDQCAMTTWTPTRLEAVVVGGIGSDSPGRSIKAVTYHGLLLAEQDGVWVAEIYFDV